MKTLHDLFRDYKTYQRDLGKLAKTTQENYNSRIGRFLKTFPETAGIELLTRPKVSHFIAALAASKPNATRMMVAAISSFCRYLIRQGYMFQNPAEDVELPRRKVSNRREPIPDDTIQQLFDACNRLPATAYKKALTRAILAVITYGGLRRCEVVGLRVEDFTAETGEVFIREGKGGKTRSIFLCEEAIEAVSAYLRLRPECTHDYLFAWSWRDRVSRGGYASILKRIHTVAGLDRAFTGHQFRHAYASRLDRNGAELGAISAALGHSRVNVTADYIHSTPERVRAIAPLASLRPSQEKSSTEPVPQSNTRTIRWI